MAVFYNGGETPQHSVLSDHTKERTEIDIGLIEKGKAANWSAELAESRPTSR